MDRDEDEYTQADVERGFQTLRAKMLMGGRWMWDSTPIRYDGDNKIINPEKVRYSTTMPLNDALALQAVLGSDLFFNQQSGVVPYKHPQTGWPMATFSLPFTLVVSDEFESHIPQDLYGEFVKQSAGEPVRVHHSTPGHPEPLNEDTGVTLLNTRTPFRWKLQQSENGECYAATMSPEDAKAFASILEQNGISGGVRISDSYKNEAGRDEMVFSILAKSVQTHQFQLKLPVNCTAEIEKIKLAGMTAEQRLEYDLQQDGYEGAVPVGKNTQILALRRMAGTIIDQRTGDVLSESPKARS